MAWTEQGQTRVQVHFLLTLMSLLICRTSPVFVQVVQIIIALTTLVFGVVIVRGKRLDKLAIDWGTFVWGPLTVSD